MRRPSKRQVFWLLMLASAIALAVGPSVPAPGPLRGVLGPVLAPLSSWLYQGSLSLRTRAAGWAGGSDAETARLQAERNAYLDEVINLRQQLDDARADLRNVSGLRAEQVGLRGRLIPASVLARDAVAWRESLLVDMGRNGGLRDKQAAIAPVLIDRGSGGGLAERQWAVLSLASDPAARQQFTRSVLVGQIEQVGQVCARVRLLTDWHSSVPAEILDPGNPAHSIACTVKGAGAGRLRIEKVPPRQTRPGDHDNDDPPVKPGQFVLSGRNAIGLPAQLYIGVVRTVTRTRPDFTLEVDPAIDYSQLDRLVIVDPAEPKEAR